MYTAIETAFSISIHYKSFLYGHVTWRTEKLLEEGSRAAFNLLFLLS